MKYQPPADVVNNPDASYVNGDPSVARQGSIPPAEAFEYPQREIVNLITLSQQTPADQDLEQLTRGVRDGKLNFCVDGGTLNQIQVTLAPPFRGYEPGLTLRVLCAHSVTGPTTISINRMNPTSVKRRDGSELQQNDILAGMVATLLCDGTFFQLQNFGEDVQEPGVPTDIRVDVPYVRNSSPLEAGDHFIGLYQPPLENINEGRTVELKSDRANTGPCTFAPNNFPTHPICRPDGTPLQRGDICDNMICWLMFDSEQWQLLTQNRAKVEVVRPRGKSVQLRKDPYPSIWNGGSRFFRQPLVASNRSVWTYSMFVRSPEPMAMGDVTPYYYAAQALWDIEIWFGAGDAAGDFTGIELIGTVGGNVMNLFWATGWAIVAGIYTGAQGTPVGFYKRPALTDIKWHHILVVADGTRLTYYLDGVMFSQGNISGPGAVNNTVPHYIGVASNRQGSVITSYSSSVRIAEVYLVDGQALDWTQFAENIGGIVYPKKWTGTFGPNGSYLSFENGSAVTTTTLGRDYSGNDNNWTPQNINVTDVLSDYPGYEN